jgi:hypothetical protein
MNPRVTIGSGATGSSASRAQQGLVERLGARAGLELLRLQHEVAAPVEVNAPGAAAAVAMRR